MTRTPILEQGVDAVFDCVGFTDTIDLALHLLRPTGMLVLVGGAGKQSVDWSLVWNRQITVQGTINFGPEAALGGRHTMAQVVEWFADSSYPVDGIVTHTFDLDDWRTGVETASAGPRAGVHQGHPAPQPQHPAGRSLRLGRSGRPNGRLDLSVRETRLVSRRVRACGGTVTLRGPIRSR